MPVWTPVYSGTGTASSSGNTQWIYPTWATGASTTITGQGGSLWVPDQNGAWQPWPLAQVTITYSYDFSSWDNAQQTPEQVAARAEQRAVQRREYEERQARRALVTERAEALLLSLLTEEQARSYRAERHFELQGSAGGWWRIRRDGQAGNVDELEAPRGNRIASWCIHPYGGFPDADAHATQYLALVTDEPGFRAAGNRTPRRRLPAGMAA